MNFNKKGSVFIYVLMLINISLIIGYVVFNNTYILNNNINVGKNSEEVFLELSNKGNINIESVRQYNSNGQGFSDFISCPQNITMSGTTSKETGIRSYMHYDYGITYCYFEYNGDIGRIFFNPHTTDFQKIYYKGELRDIGTIPIFSKGSELSLSVSNSTTRRSSSYDSSNSLIDNNNQYQSIRTSNAYIEYSLSAPTKIHSLEFFKFTQGSSYWNGGTISFLDSSRNTIFTSSLTGINSKTYQEIILPYASYSNPNNIRFIRITSSGILHYLDLRYIRVFGLNINSFENFGITSSFNDSDNTYFSFDSSGIGGGDDIDDNMNSDNYRATSTGSVLYPIALGYPGHYIDDDITPRLTIFSSVAPKNTEYYNIFWNNHITNKMIDENSNNNDLPTQLAKIGDVEEGYLSFDIFSNIEDNLAYDIKIIEFDRNSYINKNTLFPKNVWETKNITNNYGYLQLNGNILSISRYKTGNEFEFNFKDNDYALFIINNLDKSMAIRINGEERPISGNINDIGRSIYINPIDDSKDSIIETIANHIIIGGEKNFIGENFIMVGSK